MCAMKMMSAVVSQVPGENGVEVKAAKHLRTPPQEKSITPKAGVHGGIHCCRGKH